MTTGTQTVRDVLRKKAQGKTKAQIARETALKKSTLTSVLERLDKLGLTDAKVKRMSDHDLKNALQKSSRPSLSTVQPDWEAIATRLSLPGETTQGVYADYLASNKGKKHMGRSTFYLEVERRIADISPEIKVRCIHNTFFPGEVCMIDYSGDGIQIVDKGKRSKAEIFVGVLAFSGLIFCFATPDQKGESWRLACAAMFAAWGGVTDELWCDNAKGLVEKPDRIEPVLTAAFRNFCDLYQVAGIAVAPHKPKYKALVENAVKQIQSFIIKALSGRDFFSYEELNRAIAVELDKLNGRPLTNGDHSSRQERFDRDEADILKPLPPIPYAPSLLILERKVLSGKQVRINNIRYNVPWDYEGKTLTIAINYSTRKIDYYEKDTGKHIGSADLRESGSGNEPMRQEYMPEFLRYLVMSREQLKQAVVKAAPGPKAVALVETFAKQSNSRARRHLQALLKHVNDFATADFEEICRKTLEAPEVNFKAFRKVCDQYEAEGRKLRKGKDGARLDRNEKDTDARGAAYFADRDGESHEQ